MNVNPDGGWRWPFRVLLLLAATIACGALPALAGAQALYYRSIPIGDHAAGLGGAFTGVADDSSAAYYNPAGLVRGGRFMLQGSFASIVFTKYKIENAFDSPELDETFDTTSTTALPRFVGTAVKLGPKKFGDDHRFALGYSTVEVARNRLNVGTSENNPTLSVDLRVDNNYRSRWYGVSFAAEVTKKSAVGFTIFLSDQSFGYGEDIGIAIGGTFDEQTGLRVGGDSSTTSSSIGVRAYHFVPRLGWLHQISSQWAIGMMLQTPGIPLKQKGDVLRRITTDISPDEPTFFLFDSGSIKAKMPIPFELRAGFGFQINEKTVLSFDAAVTGPVKDSTLFGRPAELENTDVRSGVYFSSSIARRWTPNLSIGAEHKFGKAVVAGGLFTNFSAAPDVPETSQEYTPDHVNMWGASVAIGVDTKGYRFTVGAIGLFGKGDALAALLDENADVVSYRRTQATRAAVVLYISGAISVASKGAQQIQQKQKEKKKRKAEGNGEDAGTDAGTSTDTATDAGTGTDTGTGADTDN